MKFDGSMEDSAVAERQENPNADIIDELKKRFQLCIAADGGSHKLALEDLRFLVGEQWPEQQRKQREAEGRPVLTINKIPTFLQQVTNDQRQNKASIKISPVNEDSSSEIAEIVQGMIRHIEYDSAADTATDTAINSAAAIGFGYFRFTTEYESPMSFDQVIKYSRIRNPFTVYFDPASVEIDGHDAEFCIITSKMNKNEFKANYPKAVATIQQFSTIRIGDGINKEWLYQDDIRIAEYYRKEHQRVQISLMSNGQVVETAKVPEDAKMFVKNTRWTDKIKIMHRLCTPCEVLSETEIKCSYIPVFPVYGSEIDIDGKVTRSGLIRNARDPATMYNFWMTAATEEVALRPKTPYIGAKGQFKGEETKWRQANTRTFPYLEYEPTTVDGQLVPPPQRQPMADIPNGMLTMAMHASDNIKQTTGLFDSSLGAVGNAQSGKQELAQQKQGNVANYHFTDNYFKTLRHAGKCLLEMLPAYYDAERLVQVRAEDGTVKGVKINAAQAAAEGFMNDIRIAKFGIAVSVGPSYSTMRAEAADAMIQFGQSWPKLMDIAGDKVVKAMNWPGAEDIAKRIERTIPANLKDDADGNPPLPPEVTQQMEQMQATIKELTEAADDNHAKVTIAQINKEAKTETAQIVAENREDIEELKGWVQLLLARIPPPAELAADVGEDLIDEGPEAQPAQPDQHTQLLTQIAEHLQKQGQQPIHIHNNMGGSRKMRIQAPSGAVYEGQIDNEGGDDPAQDQQAGVTE